MPNGRLELNNGPRFDLTHPGGARFEPPPHHTRLLQDFDEEYNFSSLQTVVDSEVAEKPRHVHNDNSCRFATLWRIYYTNTAFNGPDQFYHITCFFTSYFDLCFMIILYQVRLSKCLEFLAMFDMKSRSVRASRRARRKHVMW